MTPVPASAPAPAPARSILARVLLGLICLYRHSFSVIMGTQCRFTPTCSVYTAEAIRRFGALRGGLLGIKRIGRCHPWSRPGLDPVPAVFPVKFFSKKTCSCDRKLPDRPGVSPPASSALSSPVTDKY